MTICLEKRIGAHDAISKEAYHWTRLKVRNSYVGGCKTSGGNSGNMINLLVT